MNAIADLVKAGRVGPLGAQVSVLRHKFCKTPETTEKEMGTSFVVLAEKIAQPIGKKVTEAESVEKTLSPMALAIKG